MNEAAEPVIPLLQPGSTRSVTDQVFDALHERIVDLGLPPGTRISEAEVASRMGVSRQPVRDAFFRLSQIGFVLIRPQRSTTVTPISATAIREACFIRNALEVACMRVAAGVLSTPHHDELQAILDDQKDAVEQDDRRRFHMLDDRFHQRICDLSGHGFVWELVRENKGHMDRLRWLSLSYNAGNALSEHGDILQALRARDADAAAGALTGHLGRIDRMLDQLRRERPDMVGD
ncbi:GntR family transcriptional regulator [Paracoccus sp. C2R09]|nr:GntR family transcriptional regulator [Paracoccus sp. C2R09]